MAQVVDTCRAELVKRARAGKIAIIEMPFAVKTRGRRCRPFVKVMCADREKLLQWGRARGIPAGWLHVSRSGLPHFDLWGRQAESVLRELERIEEFLKLLEEE
ncbi:MAG: hypothetical protein AB1374_05910 [Bacillota bacterium]